MAIEDSVYCDIGRPMGKVKPSSQGACNYNPKKGFGGIHRYAEGCGGMWCWFITDRDQKHRDHRTSEPVAHQLSVCVPMNVV